MLFRSEVKTYLRNIEIQDATLNLATTRRLATRRFYVKYGAEHGQGTRHIMQTKIAPRSYLIAYDAMVKKPESLANKLTAAVSRNRAHLHGVFVIKQGWYFQQKFNSTDFMVRTDNSLFWFIAQLREQIQPTVMEPMAIDPYMPDPTMRAKFDAAISKATIA